VYQILFFASLDKKQEIVESFIGKSLDVSISKTHLTGSIASPFWQLPNKRFFKGESLL
jgi:hypothetical protein